MVSSSCFLPVFLTGAFAVQMRADLGFGVGQLGFTVFVFFMASALASALLGRLIERIGSRWGMRLAAAFATTSLIGIASVAQEWVHLVGALVVGGVGNAAAHPSTHLLLARAISRPRQGLAFGLKQAATPAATLLSGLAAPLVAVTVGWRWGFAGAALMVAIIGSLVREGDDLCARAADGGDAGPTRPVWRVRGLLPPLLLPAMGIGLGSAAGVSFAAFLVESSVASGVDEAAAGTLLAAASASGFLGRVLAGWLADHCPARHLHVVAAMLVAGAAGYSLLATGAGPPVLVVAALLAFGAGWGWPGVFHFAIVSHFRGAPAAATGVTQTGSYLGSATGPLAFGLVASQWSYSAAWFTSAGLALLAAAAMLSTRPILRRRLAEP
ncbi:MAG: MFS transporter [Actinobacteria bacterium]|nr:MFS transporter [Actinomycetota bacterium]MQB00176.1 MFS transporter [Actinomycetota bacterium]